MPANCLAPIIKCAYKKAQQQIKEEAFQDGDFLQKVHQYLSSPDVLENTLCALLSERMAQDRYLKETFVGAFSQCLGQCKKNTKKPNKNNTQKTHTHIHKNQPINNKKTIVYYFEAWEVSNKSQGVLII